MAVDNCVLWWQAELKVNFFSLFFHGPETPDGLFRKFLRYRLSRRELVEFGFPLCAPGRPGRAVVNESKKFNVIDPESQVCRCGSIFSMSDAEWYVAKGGCFYHPGKRQHRGPAAGRYECCGQPSFFAGCVRCDYHVSSYHPHRDVAFKRTRARRPGRQAEFTEVYALDTEMVFTTIGMEIVKVSLVWVLGGVLYTTFVKPKHMVLDYNTAFSGVSSEDLEGVTTTVEDVQQVLLKYIHRDSILVGHSLDNDLLGLRLIHEKVVDTSIVFPHVNGFPFKNSLKSLAARYLGKTIHRLCEGHDSVEDARTCLELMLLKIHTEPVVEGQF